MQLGGDSHSHTTQKCPTAQKCVELKVAINLLLGSDQGCGSLPGTTHQTHNECSAGLDPSCVDPVPMHLTCGAWLPPRHRNISNWLPKMATLLRRVLGISSQSPPFERRGSPEKMSDPGWHLTTETWTFMSISDVVGGWMQKPIKV